MTEDILMEQGLDIEIEEYDPKKSKVTMKVSSALEGQDQWKPAIEKDLYWNEEENMFIKVSGCLAEAGFCQNNVDG